MTVVRHLWVTQETAVVVAWLTLVVGCGYAAVSAYWGFGGTSLLDTLAGTLEREARRRSAAARGGLWFTVALKLVGAVLPLGAIRPGATRWVRGLGWLEAAILTGTAWP